MSDPGFRPLIVAGLVLASGLGVAAALSDGTWSGDRAPFPFVWRDVATVQFLGALPFAIFAAIAIRRRAPAAFAVLAGAVAYGVGIVPLLPSMWPAMEAAIQSIPYGGAIIRAIAAFGLILPAALAGVPALPRRSEQTRPARRGEAMLTAAVGLVILILVPAVYVGARCRHDATRLGSYLGQYRFGEARDIIHAILMLDPRREFNGQPLTAVRDNVDGVVADLESRVAARLSPYTSPQDRFDRGRVLAMLGRTGEALDVLGPVHGPEADSLRGTIHETREEWQPALDSFREVRKAWEAQPPSPARQAALARAATGTAYALRKLGRYPEAEAAYRELLELEPTAENHFLLAQFYEDAQQAGKARDHARRAMAMEPDRYEKEGKKLISKLAVYHFGCFGVFSEESSDPSAALLQPNPATAR
jgi:hypothetical protein